MAGIAQIVDAAIRAAGIPLVSVSVVNPGVRATWIIQFDVTATPAQRTQAQGILDSVATDSVAVIDATVTDATDDKILTALARALWECIPAPTKTLVQLRARVIALLKV